MQNAIDEVEGRLDTAEGKLSSVETGATADQTASEIEALYEGIADTNKYTDAEKAKVGHLSVTQAVDLDTIESDTAANNTHRTSDGSDHTYIDQDVTTTATPTFAGVVTGGNVDGRDVSVDGAKLDGIEPNAKDDQVASEVPVTATGNLAATNVQAGLEELQSDIDSILVDNTLDSRYYTETEVDTLLAAQDQAVEITYDNTDSSIAATNVKTAIDELDDDVATVEGRATAIEAKTDKINVTAITSVTFNADGTLTIEV